MFVPQLIGFGVTLWFGLYLIHRDARNPRLALAGLALVLFAFGIGAIALLPYAAGGTTSSDALAKARDLACWMSLLAWLGAIASFARDGSDQRSAVWNAWTYGAPVAALAAAVPLATLSGPDAVPWLNAAVLVVALGAAVALAAGAVFARPQAGAAPNRAAAYGWMARWYRTR